MIDYSKIAFTSAFRYERIHMKGHVTIPTGTALRTVTIPHNLGYAPYYKLWYTFSSGKVFALFAGTSSYSIDGNDEEVTNVYGDAQNLYIELVDNVGTGHTGTIYYRIYAEPTI